MPDSEYDLEEDFPNLSKSGWRQTSDPTSSYNCIAYAAYDTKHWWDTPRRSGYYWPPGAKREDTIEGWKSAFETIVYRVCETAEPENNFEKIAIYAKNSVPMHVARQKTDGVWTSKLGPDEDIDHNTLDALEGEIYGIVVLLMKRPHHPENR